MRGFVKGIAKLLFRIAKRIVPLSLRKKIREYLLKQYTPIVHSEKTLRIAVRLWGGLGDVLISSAWMKELYRRIDASIEIDIFVPSRCQFIFLLMPYKHNFFEGNLYDTVVGYDLKLDINTQRVQITNWAPYRILDKDKYIYSIMSEIINFNSKHDKFLRDYPYSNDRFMNYMSKKGRNRWSVLNIDEAFDFDQAKGLLHLDIFKYNVLNELGLNGKHYVTIHAGCDITCKEQKQVKLWMLEHYTALCELIKKRYPKVLLVLLGTEYSLPIVNVDVNTSASPLSMEECLIVLKHSLLHIDAESGLVHMRRQLRGKSIVLFGPTPITYFGYPENININTPFHCSNCQWLTDNWFFECVNTGLGYPAPCMQAIDPEMVMLNVEKYMDSVLSKKTEITQIALEIYSSEGLKNGDAVLASICKEFGAEKLPVSENIYVYCDNAKFYIHASKQWEYPFAINMIMAHQKEHSLKEIKLADVGGGGGLLSPYLSSLGLGVTVFDINWASCHDGDPEYTEKTRIRWAEKNGLKMEWGSIFNIPAEDETFDIVTCISVVEHVPEKKYAFMEMLRVLKPGGVLIVTYDLVESGSINHTADADRAEIFTPDLIYDVLSAIDVQNIITHMATDVEKSIADMLDDKVSIPAGITVGGLVLEKECKR